MQKFISLITLVIFSSCQSQANYDSSIKFTTDFEEFQNLSRLKEKLSGVEIIAIGENTHGLGEVFATKVKLVKFLHEELDFDLILFESGYGDGALAWENIESFTAEEFTKTFTSNFYYKSEEIMSLVSYVKDRTNNTLKIQGFDCQPQQRYLSKRMSEIVKPIDTVFSESVTAELKDFNKLYQFEQNKDTLGFYKQREKFSNFLSDYENLIDNQEKALIENGTTFKELDAIRKSIEMFRNTYSKLEFGNLMGWPMFLNLRDKALFENVEWFKTNNPKAKIIIWAQNSHIEKEHSQNEPINWMGHSLKKKYGSKYYAIGTIVYKGNSLTYSGEFSFEHNSPEFLAYHLNQANEKKYLFDLTASKGIKFINQLHSGIDNGGNTSKFIAKDRFDGLLFIKESGKPKLLE